jgi:hypothetical protein
MRFTVLANTMKSVYDGPPPSAQYDHDTINNEHHHDDGQDDDDDVVVVVVVGAADGARREVASAKWLLWHGNLPEALDRLGCVLNDLYMCGESEARTKGLKMTDELRGYLANRPGTIVNYAERHRAGEPISSATAESAVNSVIAKRMVKKQQMRWSPNGAHRMLQIRCRVLDDQLAQDINRWHQPAPPPLNTRALTGVAAA